MKKRKTKADFYGRFSVAAGPSIFHFISFVSFHLGVSRRSVFSIHAPSLA